jgi:hypothetical protein
MKESGFQSALLRLASISHYIFLLLVRLKSFSGKDFAVYVPPSVEIEELALNFSRFRVSLKYSISPLPYPPPLSQGMTEGRNPGGNSS